MIKRPKKDLNLNGRINSSDMSELISHGIRPQMIIDKGVATYLKDLRMSDAERKDDVRAAKFKAMREEIHIESLRVARRSSEEKFAEIRRVFGDNYQEYGEGEKRTHRVIDASKLNPLYNKDKDKDLNSII